MSPRHVIAVAALQAAITAWPVPDVGAGGAAGYPPLASVLSTTAHQLSFHAHGMLSVDYLSGRVWQKVVIKYDEAVAGRAPRRAGWLDGTETKYRHGVRVARIRFIELFDRKRVAWRYVGRRDWTCGNPFVRLQVVPAKAHHGVITASGSSHKGELRFVDSYHSTRASGKAHAAYRQIFRVQAESRLVRFYRESETADDAKRRKIFGFAGTETISGYDTSVGVPILPRCHG